jgi:uncharacterized membrane protein
MIPEDYEWGVLLHILSFVVLVAAIAVSYSSLMMMRRARTVQEIRTWGSLGKLIGQYQVLPLASLALILTGAYLVDIGAGHWGDGWVLFSLVAVVGATANGFVVARPRMREVGMGAGTAPDGPVPDALAAKVRSPVLMAAAHVNILVVVAIVWNMTTRPGDIGALTALVLAIAIGIASALPGYRRPRLEPGQG